MTVRFGTCPTKREARQQSVIDTYRTVTGQDRIPEGCQYWTLCGPMANGHGWFYPSCELHHVVDGGLVRPEQFYGVEKLLKRAEANQQAAEAFAEDDRPKLFHGDLITVLGEHLLAGQLRPALVNLDTMHYPTAGAQLLAKTLNILGQAPGPTVVIWNVILKRARFGRHFTWQDVRHALNSIALFRSLRNGWATGSMFFEYDGTGRRKDVVMGTAVFTKVAREAA